MAKQTPAHPINRFSLFLIVMLLLGTAKGYSQESAEARDIRFGPYLGLSGGVDLSRLRDWAVSPLIYKGPLFLGKADLTNEGRKWDITWVEFGFGTGEISATRGAIYNSDVNTFYYGGSFLRQVWKAKKPALDLRTGLVFHGISNFRQTPAFLNAASVVESLNTLMLGARLNWRIKKDFSPGHFLFFKWRGGLRHYKLSTQFNLPLLHTAWRPDFSYLDDFSAGDTTVGRNNDLSLGGLRLQAKTDFTYYLRNGNAFRFSYWWDVQQSPGELNRLETAHHIGQLSLMVRLN